MNFILMFLVVIWVSAPGQMKTVEDLEETVEVLEETVEALQQELNFWKQKMESNEVKTKNIEAEFETNKVKMKNIEAKAEVNAEKIANTEENITKINSEIGQVGEDITKLNSEIGQVEEDVAAIKSEIAMRSTFCGYRNWVEFTGTITYDWFIFESNNIPGASFDLGSGRFTAGAEGTYRVDLAIGQMHSSSSSSGNGIYIEHNGQNIAESNIYSHIYTTGSYNSAESGGRSMILHLEKDDVVSVRVASVYELYYITFCVSYEGAS